MDEWLGWTVDRQSKQMVGACPAEWEISANCTKGNGTHGSVLSPYTGFRAGVSARGGRVVPSVRPSVHSAVSGRLHFGQVLCAGHGMFQLRLGYIT